MPQASELIFNAGRHLRSVMFSKQPAKLCQYYEQHGLKFKPIIINEKNHFISLNSSICILETDPSYNRPICLGGLAIYETSSLEKERSLWKYNIKNDLFYGFFSVFQHNSSDETKNLLFPSISNGWVNVIRSENIEETMEFYREVGQWDIEKHGNGPFHYASTQNTNVFELYPLRKNGSTNIEYLVNSELPSIIHYDLDGRRIQFYKAK